MNTTSSIRLAISSIKCVAIMIVRSDVYKRQAYRYTFTPGWFDEMEIKEMAIAWKAEEGTLSSMEETSLNGEKWYVERFSNLKPGEKISIKMEYPKNQYAFCDDYNKRAREGSQADMVMTIVMFVGCMAVLPLTAVVMLSLIHIS